LARESGAVEAFTFEGPLRPMPALAPYRGRANHQFSLVVLIYKYLWCQAELSL